jgi:hypothetical protein
LLTANRVERDHDKRVDCDHHGADKRQLFHTATTARSIRLLFKRVKRQSATPIRTTPFGPQQRRLTDPR